MTRILSIIIFILFTKLCYGQKVREYLFDGNLPINDSTSLVLIFEEAQTEFAKELNHRIYSDTNFIKKIKNEWFYEYDLEQGRLKHFCDYDMYFYKLEGKSMKYLARINSHCGLSEIKCFDLEDLANNGRPLHVDTLNSISANTQKEELFNSQFVSSKYINSYEWDICKTNLYPRIYYDGYFKTTIKLDTSYSIEQNIQNFLLQYKQNLNNINWNAWGENSDNSYKVKRFETYKESFDLEINIYLFKNDFGLFKDFEIIPIEFQIPDNKRLILMYRD
jgi:hypothetical protein